MSGASGRSFAVVTGGSSGIGRELARQFAQHDFDVLICADDDQVTSTAQELSARGETGGATVTPLQTDLAEYSGVESLVAAITAAGRPVDALALNAGIGNNGRFVEIDLADELRLIGTNVTSVVHLAKRVLPGMVARGSGRVLFTSSVAATMPGPFYATYAASKAFEHSLAEALRYELKDTGVTVTALMPGPTDTEFFQRADMQDTRAGQGPKDDPADVAQDAFEALMAGKDKVVAGSIRNMLQTAATRVMPDPVKAAVHARLTEPGQ